MGQGDPFSPFLFLLVVEGLNVIMKTMVESEIFKGYSIRGANHMVVYHLQFADDTLLIGEKNWGNVRSWRVALVLFEAISGLKVNFHKSSLVGVIMSESWLTETASVLGV